MGQRYSFVLDWFVNCNGIYAPVDRPHRSPQTVRRPFSRALLYRTGGFQRSQIRSTVRPGARPPHSEILKSLAAKREFVRRLAAKEVEAANTLVDELLHDASMENRRDAEKCKGRIKSTVHEPVRMEISASQVGGRGNAVQSKDLQSQASRPGETATRLTIEILASRVEASGRVSRSPSLRVQIKQSVEIGRHRLISGLTNLDVERAHQPPEVILDRPSFSR